MNLEFLDGEAFAFDDDGQDPREFHDRRRRHRGAKYNKEPGRKARQLCAQVYELLTSHLAGAADERLQAVAVLAVQPAPNSGRLLVVVQAPVETLPVLRTASAWLREQVAAGIHRRTAPELAFACVDTDD